MRKHHTIVYISLMKKKKEILPMSFYQKGAYEKEIPTVFNEYYS